MQCFARKRRALRGPASFGAPAPDTEFSRESRKHAPLSGRSPTIGNIAMGRFLQSHGPLGEVNSIRRVSPLCSAAFQKTALSKGPRPSRAPEINPRQAQSGNAPGIVGAQFTGGPPGGSHAPLVQRQIAGLGPTGDPIHDPIIRSYRRSLGLPPGGVDPITGMQVGPTDAQIKYGALWMNPPLKTGASLGITGPSTVDRYCAKYVPSDAVKCGIYPAPNITLTATGVSTGSPVSWSVTKGKKKVKITGSATKPAVTVKGVKKSKTKNDVTIRVKSGKNSATHNLSVLEPSSMTSVTKNKKTTSTLVGASLHYTVFDQFKAPVGAGVCIDETVVECDSPFKPGVLKYGFKDAPTDKNGKAVDNIFVFNSSGIPPGFCVKLDQDITVGGCGPVLRNVIVIQSTGITVTKGDCKANSGTCP